ncbi:MAG: helix-turn-helix domain-containing protein [Actinobacteria bacterium]|nr:helix-turn-helix domain-containing protein [Actinomycetota bacterium]
MLDPEWSEADRLELAAALRDLRKAAGLSGHALAARVYMSQTKISRIETGRIVPSVTDVELIVYALNADADRGRELVSLARTANTEFQPGRLRARAGPAGRQRDLQALEAQCRVQRHFLPTMVTGLIQTPAYARQALSWPEGRSPAAVEEIVNYKMHRQAILHQEDKQFVFLLTEAALRWRLLDSASMAAQIDHIMQVTELTNVTAEIIPLRTQVPVGALNVFVVYDDRLARVESETGLLVLRDPTDVRYYLELFAHYQHYALRNKAAREFLLEIADDFRSQGDV